MFRVIISGSRSWTNYDILSGYCDFLLTNRINAHEKIIIISGHSCGADRLGERYAAERGFDCSIFPAEWDKYGKKAGMLRNEQMAKVADACIVFYSVYGKNVGSTNMAKTATRHNLILREYNDGVN